MQRYNSISGLLRCIWKGGACRLTSNFAYTRNWSLHPYLVNRFDGSDHWMFIDRDLFSTSQLGKLIYALLSMCNRHSRSRPRPWSKYEDSKWHCFTSCVWTSCHQWVKVTLISVPLFEGPKPKSGVLSYSLTGGPGDRGCWGRGFSTDAGGADRDSEPINRIRLEIYEFVLMGSGRQVDHGELSAAEE